MTPRTILLIILVGILHLTAAIQRRYVTQLCPGSVGPTHGEVIRFDPNFNNTQWVIPETDIDCWLTLRGQPTTDTIQWYINLYWPSNYQFAVRGWDYANTGCDTAYIEIYAATVEGRPTGNPIVPKTCGDTAPGAITLTDQSMVLHLYAEKEPIVPTTTTLATIPAPTVAGATAATVATAAATTAAAAAATTVAATVTNDTSVGSGNGTTVTNGTTVINATIIPDTGGPYILFRADFTSYFIDCTADGTVNDDNQLQCLNNRCVDMSLRCDRYGANNCGDLGDQTAAPPGNCTVTPPEETKTDDLLPLWIVLGLLAALIIAYWCCWRPGWCPWRLARLRNCPGCRAMCKTCRSASCCKNGVCGPAKGCYTRCTSGGCNRTKSGFPERKPDDIDFNEANTMPGWLTFAHDDGMHVREGR